MFLSGLIMMGGFIALIIPGIYLMCRIPRGNRRSDD